MQASYVVPPVIASPRPATALLGDTLRRPGGRRALSVLSVVLFLGGVGLFSYPFITDLITTQLQHRLRTQFDDPSYALAYEQHRIKIGEGLTRLVIPEIGLDVLVVEGTTPSALRAGAGHYINTPLPGEAGNVAIAGHRTTFGRPFNRLNELHPGSEVDLYTPTDEFVYTAVPSWGGGDNPHPVLPTDTSVIAPPGDPKAHWLTLTTCHPKGSAEFRLVLRLQLTKDIRLKGVAHK